MHNVFALYLALVSDIAIFVLKRDVKLQLTNLYLALYLRTSTLLQAIFSLYLDVVFRSSIVLQRFA